MGTSQRPTRLLWADAAKGVAIVLVVLHHVVGKHYPSVVPDGHEWAAQGWLMLTTALKPLRMPLFFLLSGMFASAAVQRPWRRVAYSRVAGPYWLYALWLCLHGVVFAHAQALPMNRTQDLTDLLTDLLFASTGLWYLYALCLYFVLAKLARRLPPGPVVASAALVAGLSTTLPIDAYNRVSVLIHFVYFVAGAYYPAVVARAAEVRRRRQVWALVLSYAGLGSVLLATGAPRGVTTLSLSVLAIPLAIGAVAAGCDSWPRAAALAASVGRRTLPVYVLHVPVIVVLHRIVSTAPDVGALSVATALVVTVYPVLAAVAVTWACLATHTWLSRGRLRWLFRPPREPARFGVRAAVRGVR